MNKYNPVQEIFQTLEAGLNSKENLISSCEILQYLDYQLDIKQFLGTQQTNPMNVIQMQEKVIQWLSISNRVKDRSLQDMMDEQNHKISFFEVLDSLKNIQIKNNYNIHLEQKIEYLKNKIEDYQNVKQNHDDADMIQQQNIKLSQDVEELLDEFSQIKNKYVTVCEEFQILENFSNEQKIQIQNQFMQINRLKDEKEFAEGLEDIERLNSIIAEKDYELEQLNKKQKSLDIVDQNLMVLLQILRKSMNVSEIGIQNEPVSHERLVQEISLLVDEISNLKETYENMTIRLENQINNNSIKQDISVQQHNEVLNQMHKKWENYLDQIKSESDKLQQRLDQKDSESHLAQQNNQALQDQLKQRELTIGNIQNSIRSKEQMLQEQGKQQELLIQSLQNNIRNKEEEISMNKGNYQIQQERQQKEQLVFKGNQQIQQQRLQNEKTQLIQKIQQIENEFQIKVNEINELNQNQDKLNSINKQKLFENLIFRDQQFQIASMKQKLQNFVQKISELEEQNLNNQNKWMIQQNQLMEEIKKNNQSQKSQAESLQYLEQLNSQLQEGIKIRDDKLDSQQKRLNQQVNEVELLERRLLELKDIKDKNKRFMQNNLTCNQELIKLKEQNQLTQMRYQEIEKQAKQLCKENEFTNNEIRVAKAKKQEFQKLSNNDASKNGDNKQYQDLKILFTKKQNELTSLQQNYQQMVEQNEILGCKINQQEKETNSYTTEFSYQQQLLQFEQEKSIARQKELQLMSEKHLLKRELDKAFLRIQDLEIVTRQDKENWQLQISKISEVSSSDNNFQKIVKNQEDKIQRLTEIIISQKNKFISAQHRQSEMIFP